MIEDRIARSVPSMQPDGQTCSRTITTERVTEADQARLYRTADALVLPTRGKSLNHDLSNASNHNVNLEEKKELE
jgi:hypothetical protein